MNCSSNLSTAQLLGQDDGHIHWLGEKTGIHQGMLTSYQQMQLAAKQDGIELTIASGWRGFERQLNIWNNKFLAKTVIKSIDGKIVDITQLTELEKVNAILTFSALPGASRHHWGTDIDVFAPNLLAEQQELQLEPWEYLESGPFALLSHWLKEHSQSFGFYFPYDCYRGGVAHEPWHLSYAPLADIIEQQLNVKLLTNAITTADVKGKNTIINHIDEIYQNYIININQR